MVWIINLNGCLIYEWSLSVNNFLTSVYNVFTSFCLSQWQMQIIDRMGNWGLHLFRLFDGTFLSELAWLYFLKIWMSEVSKGPWLLQHDHWISIAKCMHVKTFKTRHHCLSATTLWRAIFEIACHVHRVENQYIRLL